jgi:hypothetical protein
MKSILICFALLLSKLCFSQTKEDIIDQLVIKSLGSRIDLLLTGGQKFLEPNVYTLRVSDSIRVPYRLLQGRDLFNEVYRKDKKSMLLIRVTPHIISADTIDINFGEVLLSVKKGIFFKPGLHFRKSILSVSCGGTNSYQPDFRYVYNKEKELWENAEGKYTIVND